MDKIKRKYICHIALSAIYILGILNIIFPVLRFRCQILNHIFVLFLLFIPWVLFINGFFLKHLISKIINTIVFIIPSILSIPIAFIIIIGLVTFSWKYAFVQIHDYNFKSYSISVYRTDGGATTSYGVVVRQEKEVIFGLLLVKNLYSKYHRDDIPIKILNNHEIEIEGKRIRLKRNVYFP